MKKEYKIELTVVIDDANRQSLIDAARRCLQPEGVIAIDALLAVLDQRGISPLPQ